MTKQNRIRESLEALVDEIEGHLVSHCPGVAEALHEAREALWEPEGTVKVATPIEHRNEIYR